MENEHPFWKAKTALTCYFTLAAGILVGGIALAFILLGAGIDYQNLAFPVALISLPINEGILLIITIIFARQNSANLRQLGMKKPSLKTLVVVSLAAVLLLFLAGAISAVQETIVGPDPEADLLVGAVRAQDLLQLVALVGISIAIVGPVEELAFRGFVQRGLENSYGKTAGLLVASILFGLLHGLNSLRSIIPVTVVSLFLGYVWQKTDHNTAAVGWMHGLYDAIAMIITYLAYA